MWLVILRYPDHPSKTLLGVENFDPFSFECDGKKTRNIYIFAQTHI